MCVAYFDCFAGISGDMILGALLDAGLSFEGLSEHVKSLTIGGYEISSRKVTKSEFSATRFDVVISERQPPRHLSDIEKIIRNSDLSEYVKNSSLNVFNRLAEVEAKVHGTTKEKIHFHEVGAVDAIVDVVGCFIGMELLGVTTVYASAISLGSGSVKSQHGEIPVPSPATIEILKGFPVRMTNIETELTTPTGAALITSMTERFVEVPLLQIESIGYGAGSRMLAERPNILRVFIGKPVTKIEQDQIVVAETNIDDMNPEILAFAVDKIFAAGALDVFITPVTMKKNRSAQQITVLVSDENLHRVLDALFVETSTLGVRLTKSERYKLSREVRTITTPLGKVRVKIGRWKEQLKIAPEYEDCKKIAHAQNLPLAQVYEAVKSATQELG